MQRARRLAIGRVYRHLGDVIEELVQAGASKNPYFGSSLGHNGAQLATLSLPAEPEDPLLPPLLPLPLVLLFPLVPPDEPEAEEPPVELLPESDDGELLGAGSVDVVDVEDDLEPDERLSVL